MPWTFSLTNFSLYTGSSSSATFQDYGLVPGALDNCCACDGAEEIEGTFLVKCSATKPCDYGYCNFEDYDYGEPTCALCPSIHGSTYSECNAKGEASGDELEKKLMAYMDCKSMCEECELCEGSTLDWRDTHTHPCEWYVKHDLPVSFLQSTTAAFSSFLSSSNARFSSRTLLLPSPRARTPPSQGCPRHGTNVDESGGSAKENCCHCFGSGYGVKSDPPAHSVLPVRFEMFGNGYCQDEEKNTTTTHLHLIFSCRMVGLFPAQAVSWEGGRT